MLLTIDIGNTNIVLGFFVHDKFLSEMRLATIKNLPAKQWPEVLLPKFKEQGIDNQTIKHVVIGSVVPELRDNIQNLCHSLLPQSQPLWVTQEHCRKLININVPEPHKVGIDRLINVCAAQHVCHENLLVIDLGTATKFDCVLEGTFIGGAIAPGLLSSANHLFQNASQLHRIEIKKPPAVIGDNTQACLESGLFFGYLGLLESMIARIEAETRCPLKIIMTGGLSHLFVSEMIRPVQHEPHLTSNGLRLIWEKCQ